MPTYKHPCPHCGTYIERDVVACPACGRPDPFTPGRCPSCRATVEPGWIVCPKCGGSLAAAPAETGAPAPEPDAHTTQVTPVADAPAVTAPSEPAASTPVAAPSTPPVAAAAAAPATKCTGCGSPLPAGARFCRECGTPAG